MILIIRLEVELEDITNDYELVTVTLPCNLRSVIDMQHEYIIVSCEPDVSVVNDDIQKLNDILDEINSENPEMTAEYLGILLEASNVKDIFDEEFLRRVKENDFLFEDLTDIQWHMSAEEKAACYIASELQVPFDADITKEMLSTLGKDALVDYIDWDAIWSQYELFGFKLVETDVIENDGLYLIHWK